MAMSDIVSVTRNGIDYEIYPDPETGLQQVYADGTRIGQTQTESAARLIVRNHARKVAADYVPAGDRADMTHPY